MTARRTADIEVHAAIAAHLDVTVERIIMETPRRGPAGEAVRRRAGRAA